MNNSLSRSELARVLILNILAEGNLQIADFARLFCGTLSPATVYRLLQTNQIMTPFHESVLLDGAAKVTRVSPARLLLALRGQFDPALMPELELPLARCKSAANEELFEIMEAIESAESTCDQVLIYKPVVPLRLLEVEMSQRVVALLARRYASDPRFARRTLQAAVADRRDAFLDNLRPRHRTCVITLMSGLWKMARIEPPFTGCTREQIGAALNSLLFDGVLSRGVVLAVINDLADAQAISWASKYRGFGCVSLYGSELLLKRKTKTLACRMLKATDGGPVPDIIDYHRADLIRGMGLACHGLTPIEIAKFLLKFMEAAGYRPFRAYGGLN